MMEDGKFLTCEPCNQCLHDSSQDLLLHIYTLATPIQLTIKHHYFCLQTTDKAVSPTLTITWGTAAADGLILIEIQSHLTHNNPLRQSI